MASSNGQRIFNATAVPGAGTINSDWVPVAGAEGLSIQVATTGTIVGTLTVEMSNATPAELAAGTNLTPVTYDLITPPAISGVMNFGLKVRPDGWAFARLKLVTSSGSGTITAQVGTRS